jgi:hypothetical protein
LLFKPRKLALPEDLTIKRTAHRITGERTVAKAMRRADMIAITQTILAMALWRMMFVTKEIPSGDPRRPIALAWMDGLEGCGKVGRVWRTRCGHRHSHYTTDCCHQAPCPREQRRRVEAFWGRLIALAKILMDCPRGKDYARLANELKDPDVSDCAWSMITISPKQVGTLEERVQWCLDLRAKLWRLLKRKYHAHAAFGAIEMGQLGTGNVHFHMLVYCQPVPRDETVVRKWHYRDLFSLQSWLRSTDCTVAGCDHPSDDRCDECRRAKCACSHPRQDRRPRCNGSWGVDVRRAYVKKETARFDPANGAIHEAIKYAISPVLPDALPEPGVAPSARQMEYAERVIRFQLAIRNRKRIETYGRARPRQPEEDRWADESEPDEDGGAPKCPECDERMVYAATGIRHGGRMEWFREQCAAPKRREGTPRRARAP